MGDIYELCDSISRRGSWFMMCRIGIDVRLCDTTYKQILTANNDSLWLEKALTERWDNADPLFLTQTQH